MDCGKCQLEHTFRLEKSEEDVEKLKDITIELQLQAKEFESSTKSAHKRLNEIGEQTLAIYKLGVAVESMAEQFKDFSTNFKDHEDRIDTLEREPGKEAHEREKQVKNYILIAIVGAVMGAVFMKLGVKL